MTKQELSEYFSGVLFDVNRALTDVSRAHRNLKCLADSLSVKLEEIHNSEEYIESIKKQLFGEEK